MKTLIKILSLVILFSGISIRSQAQGGSAITTGGSFLLISPDARNTGVAEAGTGLLSDANTAFINAAKLSFAGKTGASVSYVPWLRQLEKDLHLGYLSAYHQLGDKETIGMALKYLDLGGINFRDESGMLLQQYQAYELSLDGTYSRKFGEGFAMALTGRYIHSDLGNGTFNGTDVTSANAFAADVSVYSEGLINNSRYAWGISLTNIGTKLAYSGREGTGSFLPMNLRIGGGYTVFGHGENKLTFLLDVNKLMVPSPPRYRKDGDGTVTTEIERGRDPNRSVTSALFTSLFDAPGGIKEELAEFTVGTGIEFCYQSQLFLRSGYFYEDPEKGNRQHFAAGIGLNLKPFQFDVSYIAPTSKRYVLKNGIKFTLSCTLNQ